MPLISTVLLLIAQVIALIASIRNPLWRAVPFWVIYLCLATIHLLVGVIATAAGQDYPAALLYFEPAVIVCQIAFTFETSVKFLGITMRGGPPEGRLLFWLIPSVPVAIVLPIEIGFIRDALASWRGQEDESLRLVYAVRLSLSMTLLVVLALIPMVAKFTKKTTKPALAFHHQLLTAYVGCATAGYLCKPYVSFAKDYYVTLGFFIVGPLICFLAWSKVMWNRHAAELESMQPTTAPERSSAFHRGALQS